MNVIVLRRRLIYICAMVALVIPLYFLGTPSVRNTDGSIKVAGGTLAQLRSEYNLGQGDLGEIDPASESMRLATLGLRGVASTILWQKAEYYKKEQYWDRLAATLNQIAVLQPHFIEIWKFQSHNLSYNVSHEFDNYRHRYQWVKRGMDYLVKGSKLNKNRTEMPFELGWFFGNKLGVADERKQFRELYRDDDTFHQEIFDKTGLDVTQAEGRGPDQKPDNWLTGRLWYLRAYDMVDQGAEPAKSTMMFYREGPQWLMKYSEAIQKDGYLDDAARYAWRSAGRDWEQFGERQIVTSFGDTIYLTELETANKAYQEGKEDFEEFCGETYERMLSEREAQLTEEQLEALRTPIADRNFDQVLAAENAAMAVAIDPSQVAREVPEELRVEALQRAKELKAMRDKINHIEIYRNQINYAYWEQRCIAEQEDSALAARTNMFEADQLLEEGDLDAAIEKYEIAWENWDKLFNTHPAMMIDDAADEVMEAIDRYRKLLDQPELPEDFALNKFLQFRDFYGENLADLAMMSVVASWNKNYPDRNFLDEMLRKSAEFKKTIQEREQAEAAEGGSNGSGPAPIPMPGETVSPSGAETEDKAPSKDDEAKQSEDAPAAEKKDDN